MEKEKEFKNWEYIVLIIMLCVIIALLSIVLYKAINKKKEKNTNEDNIVSNTKIDEKLYKTFNRKDYDTLKNIKDNYVVRDMKIVQSDNSFTNIKLNDNEIGQIIDIMLKEVVNRLKEQKYDIELEPEVKELIAKEGIDKNFGARPLRRTIQNLVEDRLAEEILDGKLNKGKLTKFTVENGKMRQVGQS